MTYEQLVNTPMYRIAQKTCKLHHEAWAGGYISRVNGWYIEEYSGRFGTGYKIHYPSHNSTRYHIILYRIKED